MFSSGARPSPSASPSASDSPTAAIDTPSARLAISFMAAPAPGPPTCPTEPSDSRIGRTRVKSSSPAPTKISRRPSAAWLMLPLTGASTTATPFGKRAAINRMVCGPTVDMSMYTWPGPSALTRPCSPNTTSVSAWGVASIVIAKAAPAPASAGDPATVAPLDANGLARSGVRFHTVSAWPASSRRVAIGVPIWPSPRNAIFAMVATLLASVPPPPSACRRSAAAPVVLPRTSRAPGFARHPSARARSASRA